MSVCVVVDGVWVHRELLQNGKVLNMSAFMENLMNLCKASTEGLMFWIEAISPANNVYKSMLKHAGVKTNTC